MPLPNLEELECAANCPESMTEFAQRLGIHDAATLHAAQAMDHGMTTPHSRALWRAAWAEHFRHLTQPDHEPAPTWKRAR